MDSKIKELESKLSRWNEEYWRGSPSVGDSEYDKAVEELRSLDPGSSFCDFLGTPIVSSSGKVTHDVPMLSLDKAYNVDDYKKWIDKTCRDEYETLYVMPKYDGISADWKDGVLSTRGDGHVGENITDKCALIMLMRLSDDGEWYGIPLQECKEDVRGEIVMLDSDFDAIKDNFKNPRNAVAGALGAKYSVEWVMQMRSIGFRMALIPHDEYRIEVSAKTSVNRIEQLISTCREAVPVLMDGIVITLKDRVYGDILGSTAHHPRHSIAYKFCNEEAQTKLIGIEWSVGLNKVTPVAILDPVELAGVTVSRASLHNLKYIQDMDLQIGDIVTVERAGAVIPNVISRIPGMDRTKITCNICPVCGTTLMFDGTALSCINENCPGKKTTNITTAAAILGIDDLSTKTVEKMINVLNVDNIGNVFDLTKEDILKIDGFADKSAERLLNNINKARNTTDYQILAAMNIPGIGVEMAKSILMVYDINEIPYMSADKFADIPGIGAVRGKAIEAWMQDNKFLLFKVIDCTKFKPTKDNPEVTNKQVIVFTGSMPKPREHYKALAESNGYIFKDAITKATSVLVVAEEGHKSTKVSKAEKNGCKIITLKQFLEEVGENE